MWRSRRWRFLLNLIDHLPTHSFFVEAQADDPEVAARVAAGSAPEPRGPRLSSWDEHLSELTYISDMLARLLQAVIAVNGGKPPRIGIRPRPTTEIDRARDRAHKQRHEALVSRLLPPE